MSGVLGQYIQYIQILLGFVNDTYDTYHTYTYMQIHTDTYTYENINQGGIGFLRRGRVRLRPVGVASSSQIILDAA